MSNPATKYTPECRLECADCAISTGRPAAEVADELGVNGKTLQRWVKGRRDQLDGRAPSTPGNRRGQGAEEARPRAREGERAPEESGRPLRREPSATDRYRLMRAEKADYTVKMMAGALKVSRSGFYSWLAKGEPEGPWAGLRAEVKRVWLESNRTLGARSVHAFLPDESAGTTLYRVRKCMRELGIRGIAPNPKKRTTIPDEDAPARPDLMKRDFTSPVPTCRPVGDITCLRTREGWPCLATVIDLCTRMVVGWAISERMTADIVVEALERAWRRGYVAGNATFHSDRGSQYDTATIKTAASATRS